MTPNGLQQHSLELHIHEPKRPSQELHNLYLRRFNDIRFIVSKTLLN